MSLGMGVDGDANARCWKYGPPAGSLRGIYLIPTVFDWNKRTDPTHVAELNQQITNRPIGPIPFHQLRSLCLADATLDLISLVLPRAQRVLLGCLDDLDVLEAILDEIDALGGLPETLATAETQFADKMLAASGADVPIRRLARLLTNSRVRDLSLSFDISIYSREWNKPFVLSASQWLMNHGLPPGLTTLRLDGLWGPHLDGSDVITPYTVAWPVSLRHFHLKVGNAYGNEGVVVAQLLTSLAVAKVPNLVTLDVTGANIDQRDVTDAIVAALSATLTTLRLVQYYPRRPDPEDARHLCSVFQAIASKCPRLQSLHVEPKILFERNELTVLARDAIPELCSLANLNTLALVAWNLTAKIDSFWAALADTVPNLLRFTPINKKALLQVLNVLVIISSALVMWKGLSMWTNTESPIVVVLTASMEPAFGRGDLLFLAKPSTDFQVGDIVVYTLEGREIPIVHRVLNVHTSLDGDPKQYLLTKGDNNPASDYALYGDHQPSKLWITNDEVVGKVYGYAPYVGYLTIAMTDIPQLKVVLLGALGLFALLTRE
ncbi:Signal peptidase complex catalytic subunit S11A [Allomyces javanicus]|nr:Signal peptidase complex catalytic subunit S11A [Allomyces javanicus]